MYVELFRSVPLIVQFFTWYLATPELPPENIGMWFKAELSPNIRFFLSSMPYLGLFTVVRACEQVRTVTRFLPRGQKSAALAMGLTLPQVYHRVLLPSAYCAIAPPMAPEMTNLMKNFAIVSTIGLVDMVAQADRLPDCSAHTWESFIVITPAYVLINVVIMPVISLAKHKICLPDGLEDK